MTMATRARMAAAGASAGAPTFDPITGVGWLGAWWTSGPEFTALGLADGGKVATWPDEVSTLDATQATDGNRPLLTAAESTLNNKPVVQAVSSDYLKTATITPLAFPYSYVAIGTISATGGHTLLDGAGVRAMLVRSAGHLFRIDASVSVDGGAANTSPHMFRGKFNGASSALGVDETVTTGNCGVNLIDGLTFFARFGLTQFSTGYLAFVGLYAGDVTSDSGWADFKTFMADFYALTIA